LSVLIGRKFGVVGERRRH
jgi:hypothetical protein